MHARVHDAGRHTRAPSCFITGQLPCTQRYHDRPRAARVHCAWRLASLQGMHATACSMAMAGMMQGAAFQSVLCARVVCEATNGGSGAVPAGGENQDPALLAAFKRLVDRMEKASVKDMLRINQTNLVRNEVVSEESLQGLTREDLETYGLSKAAAGALKLAFPSPIATGVAPLLTITQLFEQPLPAVGYVPPSTPPGTDEYPDPTLVPVVDPTLIPVVWHEADSDIQIETDTFLAQLPQDAVYQAPQFYVSRQRLARGLMVTSEAGIATRFQQVLDVLEDAYNLAGFTAQWQQNSQLSTGCSSSPSEPEVATTSSQMPAMPATREPLVVPEVVATTYSQMPAMPAMTAVGPLVVQGTARSKKKPEFELEGLDGVCKAVIEIQYPHVLAPAGNKSLAALRAEEQPHCGPGVDAPSQFPQRLLMNIFGHVEAYCRQKRVRYFAITTYQVTWVGKIDGGRMLISRGFPSSGTDPTTLKVLLWLSIKAMGPDGALNQDELNSNTVTGNSPPTAPQQPQNSGNSSNSAPSATLNKPAATAGQPPGNKPSTSPTSSNSSNSAHLSDESSGAGASSHDDGEGPARHNDGEVPPQHDDGEAGVLQLIEELPGSPCEGVLGSGLTGEVLAGRLGDVPVAVKWAPVGTQYERWLGHEAGAYLAVPQLQGVCLPQLLYCGPASGGRYVLVLSRVYGRQLRGAGLDAALLPQALAALRALHAAGLKHGDVRLPNFILEQGGRVVMVDLGHAKPCTSRADMQQNGGPAD